MDEEKKEENRPQETVEEKPEAHAGQVSEETPETKTAEAPEANPEANAGETTETKPEANAGETTEANPEANADEAPVMTMDVNVGDLEDKITSATMVGSMPVTSSSQNVPPKEPSEEKMHQNPMPEAKRPDPEVKKKKHKKTAIIVTLVLLLVLVAAVGGGYYFTAKHFENHFYSGTVINGEDVSGMTVDQVKAKIEKEIAKYTLTIQERDGKTETLTSEDVGWAYVDDKKVDEIMAGQDPWKWFLALTETKKYDFSAGTTWDKTKTEAAIDNLDCLQSANVTMPVNAVLNETSEGATITPEVNGNEVDKTKLTAQVEDALTSGASECSITDPDCYIYPTIYSTDENLNNRMNQWNQYLSIEITYSFGDNVETVGKEAILSALTDDGQNVTMATSWIRPLVGTWADKYNTFGKDRLFKTHSGTTVTLPGHTIDQTSTDPSTGTKPNNHTSDYGWCLDSDSTAADLESAITSFTSGARNPIFYTWGTAKGWDNGDLTGTYVEVSLSEQHLWCYKDYQVVMSTDIVTGLPTDARETYPGCFAIDAKKSPATLGTLDMQGYSQPVNWWCPFDGGRGLHDAYWRDAFGGTIYQSNGSHGCVNIPEDNMKIIYDTVSIGTAVCVY